MKQAVMVSPGKIEFREIDKPTPGPGEILMATKRIGVCGSDIHVFHGKHPYTSYPVVQGHEVSGVIAALGEGVEGLAVGEQITFMPQLTCGECYPCKHGMYHICENLKVYGFQTNGSGQEYFPLPAELVIKVPDNIPLDHAAMIEPVSVGVHAIRRGGGVEGKRVLVLGAGTIGNLTAQVALAQGARDLIITDISPYKLDKARKVGIPHTINPNETDLETALLEAFGPERADLILECVGVQPTITAAVNIARKGTTIVVVGVFGEKPTVDLGLVQDRELSLVGTLMYQQVDYEIALDLIVGGKLNLDEMITAHFPFEQYLEAYHAIEAAKGDSLKVMISMD
ncbi:MAG: alcohol dehydrogenase catalytic domain-containing protein [Anaerolineales bacterium]|nr:alcohol dehydrogenase catalytic domain-containing protein [Anaerolineales bacterium]